MYVDYWGFKEKPFENTVDPRFIYYSAEHKEALMRLYFVVKERKGLAVLSGDYGSGKTLLVRVLFEKLIQEKLYKTALILNPTLTGKEFLEETIYQLKHEVVEGSKVQLLRNFSEILQQSSSERIHPVVIVDEAQLISDEKVMEELRLFTNYQQAGNFLLTLILVGQPELKERIFSFEQFRQRIALHYHLTALGAGEVGDYVLHRCKVAGRASLPFDEKCIRQIYEFSRGIPRKINLICDLSLLQGMYKDAQQVTPEILKEVVEEIEYVENK